MDPTSGVGANPTPKQAPTRSHFLTHHFRDFWKESSLLHPQKEFTRRLHEIDVRAERMSPERRESQYSGHMPTTSDAPAEDFEPRQTFAHADFEPHPERSLELDARRQALVDDILALYSCDPSIERVKRYTPDAIYDDELSYADDRHRIAGQWFAMPKVFQKAVNEGYEVIRSDNEVIQFKKRSSWTFRLIPKTITIDHLITLSLDPATRDSEFMQIKYHKDQANEKEYSHEGTRFELKKFQAEATADYLPGLPELRAFEGDRRAGKRERV